MAFRRKTKQAAQRRKVVRYSLTYDSDKWVKSAEDIKKLREDLQTDCCPVCGKPYGIGMNQVILDHDHENLGLVRGCLCASCNLFEGRITKYFNKLLRKKDVPIETILENLIQYLKDSKKLDPILHGAIVEAEKRRVSKWKMETIYNKLIDKQLDLIKFEDYDKQKLVELWLQQFIKEKEECL